MELWTWIKLAWITSRFNKVCQRERGKRVSVTSSPSNCMGVEKTSGAMSSTVRAAKPSSAKVLYISSRVHRMYNVNYTFILSYALH